MTSPGEGGTRQRRRRPLRARTRRFLLGLVVGGVISAVMAGLTSLGYFFGYQRIALDLYLSIRGDQRAREIVLVGIDDTAFQRLNERQPLPREYLAGVVRGLRKSGARLLALDVDLRQHTVPDDDGALVVALRGTAEDRGGPAVVARTLTVTRAADGVPQYRLVSLYDRALEEYSGFAEVPRDEDGFFRRLPLAVALQDGTVAPSFTLSSLAHLGQMSPASLHAAIASREPIDLLLPEANEAWERSVRLSPLRFSRADDWRINFIGPAGTFLTIDSDPVYALGVSDETAAQDNPFRDRIVLIGATFAESRDFFPTPRGLMSGLEIHANILYTLLTRTPIRPVDWAPSLLLQLVLCVALSALFCLIRPTAALAASLIGLTMMVYAIDAMQLVRAHYWLDYVTPILAVWLSSNIHDRMDRRRIRQSFHQYVGREVADRVYRDDASLLAQRRTVSIMFADLRGFTALAEETAPEQVTQQLNEYFEVMIKAIEQHHGIINDFLGDAITAIFGAPIDDPRHALNAVQAGLAMQAGLEQLNDGWEMRGLPRLRMGIAVHTGSVFAGHVGGRGRMKYTVVGDPMNLASRVEHLNKELQTRFLITGDTYALVKDRVTARDCGERQVTGRRQAVRVYEVR